MGEAAATEASRGPAVKEIRPSWSGEVEKTGERRGAVGRNNVKTSLNQRRIWNMVMCIADI